jgi:hypothetical protein
LAGPFGSRDWIARPKNDYAPAVAASHVLAFLMVFGATCARAAMLPTLEKEGTTTQWEVLITRLTARIIGPPNPSNLAALKDPSFGPKFAPNA